VELRGTLRAGWHWVLPVGVALLLMAPLLFSDRSFATDWSNHYWLIWVQGLNIQDLGGPSYFLQSSLGAFYPIFAFYGGSLDASLGLVARFSNPETGMVVAYVAALAAAYLGWTWLAMQAGVRGWRAQIPGCIAVTAPYAVSNYYGRGDIAEMLATSMIPVVAASALSLVRQPRTRLTSAVPYVIGVAVLTGTHTLTLVWGTTFLLACAAVVIACNWQAARDRANRLLTLAGLAILGIAINAWILVPLFLYHGRLLEGAPDPITQTVYTNPAHLIVLARDGAGPNRGLCAALPILALVWAAGFGALYWGRLSAFRKRLALGLTGLLAAFIALLTIPSLIENLPSAWGYIQFPYRLVTYADLCVVGLVTLALAALEGGGARARFPVGLLAAIAAVSVVLSVHQIYHVRSWFPSRDDALASSTQAPTSWYAGLQFGDGSGPLLHPTLPAPLHVPIEEGRRDSYEVSYPAGPAGTASTNIATGDYLVDVSGARPVGHTGEGQMVVRLPDSPERSRTVTVKAASGFTLTAARWLSILALAGALIAAVAYAAASRRRAPELAQPGRESTVSSERPTGKS
jgi:hypothetical protein